jgi:hypothetical protein
LWAATAQINPAADGDEYIYSQSYTPTRSYMNVGQYYGGYSTHYYVGLASWTGVDLSSLAGQSSAGLAVYVQNFVDPVFGAGGPNSQPTGFTYPTTGNFTLKVVALSGTPNTALMTDTWVKTNMIDAAAVGSVTLTSSGYTTLNIGSTVANWISAGNGSRWLGFVGTGSTTSIYTSVQLKTLEPTLDLDGGLVAQAAPMYLSAPSTTLPTAPVARSCRILSGNQLEMIFETVPNISYTLKTKSNLSDPTWVTVSSFVAVSTSTTLTQSMTNSPGRGFYRLEIVQ